jgi:L-rhamnonate dehydratase
LPSGGVDFSEKASGNWLNSRLASPLSIYPEYRENNLTWGRNALGSFVVEVEAVSGEIGVGVSSGGVPACWIIENHLAKLVEGRPVDDIKKIWELMWRASLYYGRRGLAIHALSAVDLALWDLLGKLRGEPVFHMLSRRPRSELPLYATTPRPDLAEAMGFVGGKLPLINGPADGEEGLAQNLDIAEEMRARTDKDFFLACDAWMSLDVAYAQRLAEGLAKRGFWFLEDFLLPDDYWGFAQVRRNAPPGFLIATGEHEAMVYGFKMLIEQGCCDIVQPDVAWCGGLTELLRIADYAEVHDILLIPHASSVFGYHFMIARPNLPFGEFVNVSDDGAEIVPMYGPLFINEPLPQHGRIRLSDAPGFGVELDRGQNFSRPFPHASKALAAR